MVSTVSQLLQYYDRQRAAAGLTGPSRGVLWAHNSHLGDARHTEVRRAREWNVGQLVREQYGLAQCFNVGFTTFDGTVSAARSWGAERETMTVSSALAGSYEELLHRVASLAQQQPAEQRRQERDFALLFRSNGSAAADRAAVAHLAVERLERAIGVQYVKRTERQSHYMVRLRQQRSLPLTDIPLTLTRPVELWPATLRSTLSAACSSCLFEVRCCPSVGDRSVSSAASSILSFTSTAPVLWSAHRTLQSLDAVTH